MCAFEGKATAHSQFLARDKFRVTLRERTYLGHRQIIEICVVRCVAPLFVLTVGIGVGALMPMRMLRPSLVLVCVGDVLFSVFRATGGFMFAGSRRLRFCRRRLLRFRLRRPANVGDLAGSLSNKSVLSWRKPMRRRNFPLHSGT